MLLAIKNRLVSLLQLILVITYIIFEELIWEGVAKPIYDAIHALKVLQKLEIKLQNTNTYVVLVLFVILLVIVEVLGLYAGILFVSGQVIFGLSLYLSKIPIAAFTFWLFRVTEDKLMQFGWFKWIYDQIMRAITWLQESQAYKQTMERIKQLKESIRSNIILFKKKYFSKKSSFLENIKTLYRAVKESLKR